MPAASCRRLAAAALAFPLLVNKSSAFSVGASKSPCRLHVKRRQSTCTGTGTFRPSSMTTSSPVILTARKRRRRKSSSTKEDPDDQYAEHISYENPDIDDSSLLSTMSSSKFQPNRRERMEHILERDGYNCVWCRVPLNIDTATTDHLLPRIKGGPSWVENELASCRKCNKMRGHTMPIAWLDECCQERGWDSNDEAIVRGLHALDEAILRQGGQRRVRPYLARQLRLLEKRDE